MGRGHDRSDRRVPVVGPLADLAVGEATKRSGSYGDATAAAGADAVAAVVGDDDGATEYAWT